ncbi:MAG: alpha/beta hydrolase [Candidatus Tectomicrobia bacterium]|uniref:Alpha/beta hydrolase n=1 Tax=Tectimicrobiota bacterium TaxID=2528274 RepID=A0A938B5H8_UNCTE|nr:alpha/beta hydrolase [Candidatus Tectomicrobia bacterium]
MFEGFEHKRLTTSGTTINLVTGGHGPGLLLLHGYPQTHAMWHKIAPRLAQDFTVVVPDLRGYGDSGKPHGDPAHLTYSKRAMAQDQAEVMQQLGFETFYLVGHDRGARVSHRLTLDHAQRVRKLAVLDIIPTHRMFAIVNKAMATATYHWFFLIQPYDLPERLIGAAPERFLQASFGRAPEAHTPEALAEYIRCFDPAGIHATCEDYRAGASIDLVYDEEDLQAGKRVTCPLLALWSDKGYVGRTQDILQVWRDYATDVRGQSLPCGHFLAEEMPEETYTLLRQFLLA